MTVKAHVGAFGFGNRTRRAFFVFGILATVLAMASCGNRHKTVNTDMPRGVMLNLLLAINQYDALNSVLPSDNRGPDFALYKLKGTTQMIGGAIFRLDESKQVCNQDFVYYINKDVPYPNLDEPQIVAVTRRPDLDGYFWFICSDISLYKARPGKGFTVEQCVGYTLEQLGPNISDLEFNRSRMGSWQFFMDAAGEAATDSSSNG